MIVVRLQGGLGNQMFQYAFGQYLSECHGHDVCYDCSAYETDPIRSLALNAWHLELPTVDDHYKQLMPKRHGGRGMANLLRGSLPLFRVREKQPYQYQPSYLSVSSHSYLIGYWQNEKYFAGIERRIRSLFQPRKPISKATLRVAEQIDCSNSVAVHVRRTDYVNHPFLDVCDDSYYTKAITHLLQKHEGVKLFIFSDDPSWCVENLDFICPSQLVLHNTAATAHEDIWLMSRCRHLVIPNSSFSWWGAWLKEETSGDIIVPDNWFSDPEVGGNEIAPDRWTRLSEWTQRVAA